MKKTAVIAEANYAQLLSELVKAEPYVPWEKVLSYSNMAVLLTRTTGESDFERGLSDTTKWRAQRNLSMHGLIPKNTSNNTTLNSRISHFAREYADHITRQFAEEILPSNAVVLWQKGYSFLFKVRKGDDEDGKNIPKHFLRTALSVYAEYEIQLFTNETYYYYSPGGAKLSLDDIVLHTLMIDPGSQTYAIYALLLILKKYKKMDLESLMKRSQRYNLTRDVENIVRYIHSKGKERVWPLPSWGELKEQANVYGIEIRSYAFGRKEFGQDCFSGSSDAA